MGEVTTTNSPLSSPRQSDPLPSIEVLTVTFVATLSVATDHCRLRCFVEERAKYSQRRWEEFGNTRKSKVSCKLIIDLCRFLSDKYSSILLVFSDRIQLAMYNSIIPHTEDHHFVVRLNSLSLVFLFNRYGV